MGAATCSTDMANEESPLAVSPRPMATKQTEPRMTTISNRLARTVATSDGRTKTCTANVVRMAIAAGWKVIPDTGGPTRTWAATSGTAHHRTKADDKARNGRFRSAKAAATLSTVHAISCMVLRRNAEAVACPNPEASQACRADGAHRAFLGCRRVDQGHAGPEASPSGVLDGSTRFRTPPTVPLPMARSASAAATTSLRGCRTGRSTRSTASARTANVAVSTCVSTGGASTTVTSNLPRKFVSSSSTPCRARRTSRLTVVLVSPGIAAEAFVLWATWGSRLVPSAASELDGSDLLAST